LDAILIDLGVTLEEKNGFFPTVILPQRKQEFIHDLLAIDGETRKINPQDYKSEYNMATVDSCLERMLTYGNSRSYTMTIKQLRSYIKKIHQLMVRMRMELNAFDGELKKATGKNSYLSKKLL